MKKDKQKVTDEVWTEDRVREFLQVQPVSDTNPDFHMLLKAYQAMRADDFELFIGMFLEAGHDINASDKGGRNVLAYVREHSNGADYAAALSKAGAL